MGIGTLAFCKQGDSDSPAKRTEPDVAGLLAGTIASPVASQAFNSRSLASPWFTR